MTSDHTLDLPVRAASAAERDGAGPSLRPDTTVGEALGLLPYAGIVLAAFRVDTGRGARTLAEAAHAADLDPAVLLDALQSTVCVAFDPTVALRPGGR